MIETITVQDLKQMVDNTDADFILLDVRGTEELVIARINDARVMNIPLSDLPSAMNEIPRHAKIVTLCHHGVRSERAALALQEAGFANVVSCAGGIDHWSVEIDASVARY